MSAMKFGYFANTNNRHLSKPYGKVLAETVEITQYLDTKDWNSIWFTEHHFGHEGFEVCPNPVMMSTWAAAHSKQLRIGQAANIITFWHPLRFAEDLAMLDHMSGGRVECAVGRGLYGREALNLNKSADTRNPAQNFRIFAESLEIIRRAWSEPYFEFKGEFFQFPDPGFAWDHAMSPKSPNTRIWKASNSRNSRWCRGRCSSRPRPCTRWSMAIWPSSSLRKTISGP